MKYVIVTAQGTFDLPAFDTYEFKKETGQTFFTKTERPPTGGSYNKIVAIVPATALIILQ